MTTQTFAGSNQLINRLTAQVGSRDKALSILRERGQMYQGSEKFTPAGAKRNAMTAQERAIDRASTRSGNAPEAYKYSLKTNRATLK